MRFLTRSLAGVFILCLTLGLVALALNTLLSAAQQRADREGRQRPVQERVFSVNVGSIEVRTATPVITAFGDVASRRTLDIRTRTGGTVIRISDAFRDGGQVAAGDVLLEIDPADAKAALDIARAELAEEEASARETATRVALAEEDLAAARQTRDLRAVALARQRDLAARGAGTGAAVETAEIALASADQALVGRRQALAQAQSARDLATIAVERRKIALREAERALAETTLRAPFAGLLSAASAVEGGLVSPNEKIGSLIDTSRLEVAFRVSNSQFARLIDESGQLQPAEIRAVLDLDDIPITVKGTLERAGAEVGTGQTGRLLYARLDARTAVALRPGDFLTVEIAEQPLRNVAVIPATAANSDGEILLLGPDDRLEAARVAILRRQGNDLIVANAPKGREFALERPPQLGPGVKIRPIREGAAMSAPEMISLDAETRARLTAAVEANTRMPDAARERILAQLATGSLRKETFERLNARAGGDAAPASETVKLDPEKRARLIAFVEGNTRMPSDVKDRLLAQLNAEDVPADVVARLEGRMGG